MKTWPLRPSAALLSKKVLRTNLRIIRKVIKNHPHLHRHDAKIMAVVKADAYGHDLRQILPELERNGIHHFAVATLEEGVEARNLSGRATIHVLGGTLDWTEDALRTVRKYRLSVSIHDLRALRFFIKHRDIPIHIKLDTGMNRLGLRPEQWGDAIYALRRNRRVIEGLFTHFAVPTGPVFERQVMIFEEAVRWFLAEGPRPRWIHCDNSGSLFAHQTKKRRLLSDLANLVRPGLSLYGYLSHGVKTSENLRPLLELIGEVCLIKRAERGEGISYDHIYHVPQDHEYAVVPLGYADGLSKYYLDYLSPELRTRGGKWKGSLKVCGTICMDMVMVRPLRGKLELGDQVVFWGRFPNPLLKRNIVGPYELNLRIAKRIPRIWVP